ncbi:hypothetical protein [Aurantivibrio plasticivorans]
MADIQQEKLLVCQNEGCNAQFVDEVDKSLEGDAASLPSALKAHKAGWQIVDGKILCPSCAKSSH